MPKLRFFFFELLFRMDDPSLDCSNMWCVMFLLPYGELLYELFDLDFSRALIGPVLARELGLKIILTYLSSSSDKGLG
jgi:hypothetical protein